MPDYYGKYSGEAIDSILEDSELRTYRKQQVDDLLADKVSSPAKAVQDFVSTYGAHYMKDYTAQTVSNYTAILAAARAASTNQTLFYVPWAQEGEMCQTWINGDDYVCFGHNNITYICTPTGYAYESSITVDNELSTESTNPVQNKVITGALNTKIDKDVNNLTNYLLKTATGAALDKSYVSNTNTFTVKLLNSEGTVISTADLLLPIADAVEALSLGSNGVLTLRHHTAADTTLDLNPLIADLVPTSRTIAGMTLQSDIAAADLGTAIGLNDKVDKINGKGLSTNDFTNDFKTKLEGIEAQANKTVVDSQFITSSTNPVQSATIKAALDLKADASALDNYSLITATGNTIQLTLDSSTYEITATLYNAQGTVLSTSDAIDLPLETMVVDVAYYDVDPQDPAHTNFIRITLKNGTTTDVPIGGLISGLVPTTRKIAGHALSADITTETLATDLGIPTINNNITALDTNKLEDKELTYDGTHIKDGTTNLSFSALNTLCTAKKYQVFVTYNHIKYPVQVVKSTEIVFSTTISDTSGERTSNITMANDDTVTFAETAIKTTLTAGNVLVSAGTLPSGEGAPSGAGVSSLNYCGYDPQTKKVKFNYITTTTASNGVFDTSV